MIKMNKITLLLVLWLFGTWAALACPVCEKQQPKVLQGISHGAGPNNDWDYLIVWVMVALVGFTLYFSIKMLIKPGERMQNHIKRTILSMDDGNEK